NSKFFHGIINKKRSQLAIRRVFDNGLWCTNSGKVKEAFFNHFEARFKKPVTHRFMLNFPFNKWFFDMQAADLERNVSQDKIRLAVWNCGENKSPDVLEAFGFGQTWCKWIRGTFSSAEASILVNGSPFNEFSFHCGLKQVDEGLFKGVHLQGSISISHLFYADDATFIGEWSDANLKDGSLWFRVIQALYGPSIVSHPVNLSSNW
nr:RNA-directed DNA polymerase, eukaryota [Tanacetum cinerariifolium]